MLSFFSAKGGSGCSVTTAACALLSARTRQTLLVDLDGDQLDLLGVDVAHSSPPGLTEWFSAAAPLPDTLRRLEVSVSDSLALLPAGAPDLCPRPGQIRILAHLLASEGRTVVVDVGSRAPSMVALLSASERTVLVTRACYLALRAAAHQPGPDDVVLVAEPGRALGARDVGASLGVEVGPMVKWDPAVARAVDAGLLVSRLPRALRTLEVLL